MANSVKKYFNYFGLPYTATIEEVKIVYRSMAKRLHPDVNPSKNAEEEFLQLKKSYDYLSDYFENGKRYNETILHKASKPTTQPAPKVKKTRREFIQEKLKAKFQSTVNQFIASKSFRIGFLFDTVFDWFKLILSISVYLLFPLMSIITGSSFTEFIGITAFSSIFFLPIAIFTYIGFAERNTFRKSILKAVKAVLNKS
jgi:hypothetical protein